MPKIELELPNHFYCPFEKRLMRYPIVIGENMICERQVAISWFVVSNLYQLMPDYINRFKISSLKEKIDSLLQRHNILTCEQFLSLIVSGKVDYIKQQNYLAEYLATIVPTQVTPQEENFPVYMGPLHLAIYTQDKLTMQWLIEEGAPLDVQTYPFLLTPLHLAVILGFKEGVELLLSAGANGMLRNSNGDTPLHINVKMTMSPLNREIRHYLVTKFPDSLEVLNSGNMSPSFEAEFMGNHECAMELMQYKKKFLELTQARQEQEIEIITAKNFELLSYINIQNHFLNKQEDVELVNSLMSNLVPVKTMHSLLVSPQKDLCSDFVSLHAVIDSLEKNNVFRSLEVDRLMMLNKKLARNALVQEDELEKSGTKDLRAWVQNHRYLLFSATAQYIAAEFTNSSATIELQQNDTPGQK